MRQRSHFGRCGLKTWQIQKKLMGSEASSYSAKKSLADS
jgi:hypothetical protein